MQKARGSGEGSELDTEFGRDHLNLTEHGIHWKVKKERIRKSPISQSRAR